MAAMHAEDVHASFLFVGNLNGNHQEWLFSIITKHRGVAAFDFATVSVVISWLMSKPMHMAEHLTS